MRFLLNTHSNNRSLSGLTASVRSKPKILLLLQRERSISKTYLVSTLVRTRFCFVREIIVVQYYSITMFVYSIYIVNAQFSGYLRVQSVASNHRIFNIYVTTTRYPEVGSILYCLASTIYYLLFYWLRNNVNISKNVSHRLHRVGVENESRPRRIRTACRKYETYE